MACDPTEISDVLCSPGLGLSCAACCPPIRPAGYDHVDHRPSLRRLLSDNRVAWLKGEIPTKHELGFWCQGLGFLDSQGRRVGCLLHPMMNQGRDLRQATGYADKCRREWCQEARAWAALKPEERQALLPLCADLDGLAFGSPRENPLRRVLALGPVAAGGVAGLGLASLEELAALPFLDSTPPAWGWLLGLVVQAQGAEILARPDLATRLARAVEALERQTGPRPPLEQGQALGDLCDQWEARFWRGASGRSRIREDDLRRWRGLAQQVAARDDWR